MTSMRPAEKGLLMCVSRCKVAALRAQGASWREIAARLGVGIGTVHRAAQGHSKNLSLATPVSG